MRNRIISLTCVVAAAAALVLGEASTVAAADDSDHWYTIEVDQGSGTYYYHGSTHLDEKALLKAALGSDFIQLENLVYFDNQNRPKSWNEWQPNTEARVFINPKTILSIRPMRGNPLSSMDRGPESAD